MSEDYINKSREEANKMAEVLRQLNVLFDTKKLDTMYAVDSSELREKTQNILISRLCSKISYYLI